VAKYYHPEHELARAGFRILWQGGELGGDLICALAEHGPGSCSRPGL